MLRRFLRSFFAFRVPVIIEVTALAIYVHQRPCLLLHWRTAYAFSIRIKRLRKSYVIANGSVVMSIPANLQHITFIASNIWGSTRRDFSLKKIAFDEKTEKLLTSNPQLVSLQLKQLNRSKFKDFNYAPVRTTMKLAFARTKMISSTQHINASLLSFEKPTV